MKQIKPIFSPGTPWRNLLVLGIAIFLTGSSFNCTINLLSTINIAGGLGTAVNGVIFGVQSFISLVLPPILMDRLGPKLTLALALALYVPYIAGNLNPIWSVYIPLAVAVGFGAGVVWPTALTFCAFLAKLESDQTGKPVDQRGSLYFGVFYMFFTISNVAGNLVSYFVLKPETGLASNETVFSNVTEEDVITGHCGVHFCDAYATAHSIIIQPSPSKIHLLTGIFMCVAAAAALLVIAFVDPVENENSTEKNEENKKSSAIKMAGSTMKLFYEPDIILLLPITLFTGIEYSFMASDFTKAYVGCSWGVQYIGLVTMVLGVSATVASCSLGWMVGLMGRVPVFVAAGVAQAGAIAALWLMDTQRDGYYLFYVVAVIWGISDTVWQAQVKALYGTLFSTRKSEAYSLLCCIECLGFVVGFACSAPLCTEPKLYLLSGVLLVGMAGYAVVELRVKKQQMAREEVQKKTAMNIVAPVEVFRISLKE